LRTLTKSPKSCSVELGAEEDDEDRDKDKGEVEDVEKREVEEDEEEEEEEEEINRVFEKKTEGMKIETERQIRTNKKAMKSLFLKIVQCFT